MGATRPQSAKHRQLSLPSSIEEHWHAHASEEPAAADTPEDAVPFFVLAGLMGSDRSGKALPSHAGSSMPTRFDAPITGHGRSSLFLADTTMEIPVHAGPSIPSKPHQRPVSAPVSRAAGRGGRPSSAASQRTQPTSLANEYPFAAFSREDEALAKALARKRAAASRPSVPPLQTLDRVLQKELAYGRLGFPQGHYRAPTNQLPAEFTASLMRDRGRSKLRDVTMIPTTLRTWESVVERSTAATRGVTPPRGGPISRPGSRPASRPGSAASSSHRRSAHASAATQPPAQAGAPAGQQPPESMNQLTPYEMRRFLQHSQRYFLSVRGKEPFSTGRR
jgi:hypothetical protein